MRSSTESGFGSTCRGHAALLLLDEPLQRALEEVHREVLERDVLGRRQLGGGAAVDQRLLGLALGEPGAERLDARVLAQPLLQLALEHLPFVVELPRPASSGLAGSRSLDLR